jgi:glycosyltransferase involved in cell wall biosynthesis
MRGLSIVIPCYNSELTLTELVERLVSLAKLREYDLEIVMVEDGSADGTWMRIEELARRFREVQGIRMLRNFGQHNALLCGIRAASHAVIVTIDDDLQNPPEEIPKLLAKLDDGFDVVYGTPHAGQHGLLRNAASRITKLALQKSMGAESASSISAFRAFRSHLRDAFAGYRGAFVSIDVLLTWATRRFGTVTARHDARTVGVSNYTMRKLIVHALNLMTGFSVLPLQIATGIGLIFTVFGMAVLAFVIGRYVLEGTTVQGFPFLASMIAIFSGAQLFALGIIGEYLARIHVRTMDQPSYCVWKTTKGE